MTHDGRRVRENRGRSQLPRQEGAVGVRQLQGRHQQVALPDAEVDGVAGIPRLPPDRLLPGSVGHEPGVLVEAIDARFGSEAEGPRHLRERAGSVLVERERDLVEDRVAGAHQPLGDGEEPPFSLPVPSGRVDPVPDRPAEDAVLGAEMPAFEPRGRGDDFER